MSNQERVMKDISPEVQVALIAGAAAVTAEAIRAYGDSSSTVTAIVAAFIGSATKALRSSAEGAGTGCGA